MQGINKQGQFIINKGNSTTDVFNHIYANGNLPKVSGGTIKTVYKDYTNFYYEVEKPTANAWWFFDSITFPFVAGTSYLYRCWIRCNTCNIPIHLRAARGSNDWDAPKNYFTTTTELSDNKWHEYCVFLENMPSEYIKGNSTYVTKPLFEAYSENLKDATGDPVIIDFDIKNIEVVPTDVYIPYTALLEDTSNVKIKENMAIANSLNEF